MYFSCWSLLELQELVVCNLHIVEAGAASCIISTALTLRYANCGYRASLTLWVRRNHNLAFV